MTEQDRPGPEMARGSVGGSAGGDVMAVLPLRDIVVFPHMIVPLSLDGRNPSARWKP